MRWVSPWFRHLTSSREVECDDGTRAPCGCSKWERRRRVIAERLYDLFHGPPAWATYWRRPRS